VDLIDFYADIFYGFEIQFDRIHNLVLIRRRQFIVEDIIIIVQNYIVIRDLGRSFIAKISQKCAQTFRIRFNGIRTIALRQKPAFEFINLSNDCGSWCIRGVVANLKPAAVFINVRHMPEFLGIAPFRAFNFHYPLRQKRTLFKHYGNPHHGFVANNSGFPSHSFGFYRINVRNKSDIFPPLFAKVCWPFSGAISRCPLYLLLLRPTRRRAPRWHSALQKDAAAIRARLFQLNKCAA
jgi:hypothetical protein